MKKVIILLLAITSFFVSLSAWSQNTIKEIDYAYYSNSPNTYYSGRVTFQDFTINQLLKETKIHLKDGTLALVKSTLYQYSYTQPTNYVLSKNADIIVIFTFEETKNKNSQKIKTFYKKLIKDIRNNNPSSTICGIYLFNGNLYRGGLSNSFRSAIDNAFHSFPNDNKITSFSYDMHYGYENFKSRLLRLCVK